MRGDAILYLVDEADESAAFGRRNDFLGTRNDGKSLESFGLNPGGYVIYFDPSDGLERVRQIVQNLKGSADQINFDPQDDVAHIFCSLHAGFRDLFRNRGRFFSFYASFEAALGAFRAALPTMGVVLP